MSNIIRKELLSAIMDKKITHIESNLCYFAEQSSCMLGTTEDKAKTYWNIHELAHKCKVWAYDNNFNIEEKPFRVTISHNRTGKTIKFQYDNEDQKGNPFNCKYVFKACQWIYDNAK